MTATARLPALPRPRRSTLVWGLVLVNVEALFVLTYVSITGRVLLDPFLVYPFVWINVGLWALVRTDPPEASGRRRLGAIAVALGYFAILAVLGTMVGPGEAFGGNPATGLALRLYGVPPGWAPALIYNGTFVHVSLVPPYVVGFLALTYLVYATALDAATLVGAGLVGVFSCVTCTLPLVAAFATSLVGGSVGAILSASSSYVYVGGTAIYVLTVGLLYWRPGVD